MEAYAMKHQIDTMSLGMEYFLLATKDIQLLLDICP
jgi:hypothetical protein